MTKTTLMPNHDIDLDLFLCTEILKLKSLHFGYWEHNEELSLANLRKAQNRFTSNLIKLIPKVIGKDQGVAVGSCLYGFQCSLLTGRARDELNHKWLTEIRLQVGREHARREIVRSAGGVRRDQRDGPIRVLR